MFTNCLNISIKEGSYLLAVQPYRLILQPNFNLYS